MKYQKNTRCDKCGCTSVSTKYEEHERFGEQMKRVCGNCNYTWFEEPLDKEE